MSLHRFFVEELRDDEAIVSGEEYKHLSRVMRLGQGDRVIALDGKGLLYEASIEKMFEAEALLRLHAPLPSTEPKTKVTIYQALPKADKLELVLQKCTELGASRFVLLETRHCVARPKDLEKKMQRWRRVILEAAKQSCRAILPALIGPIAPGDISAYGDDSLLWLDEEGRRPLCRALEGAGGRIGILVGPEGGWSAEERRILAEQGAVNTWLGPRILRTETAGMASLSAVLYDRGDMGE